ncbi:hypothetical protein CRG98_028583, partial [Punica granatum]
FIFDLPARLGKCIKSEAYADAVKFYTGAMPIFKAYGDSSFQDCKRASEEAIATIIKNLQGKLFSDSESIQSRAEAAVLLKQLDFPVDSLKAKLLEKLEQSLADLEVKTEGIESAGEDSTSHSGGGSSIGNHEASVGEFAEAVRAYRVIFPDSDKQLISLSRDLITRHFEVTEQYMQKHISSAELLNFLKIIWTDVLLLDNVLEEAGLPDFSLEAARLVVKKYISSKLTHFQQDIADSLVGPKERVGDYSLQDALEAGKKTVLQGSMDVLLDFRQLLDDKLELVIKLRDSIIDWVLEGFQVFFRTLDDHFVLLSEKKSSLDQGLKEGAQTDKALTGLVLVLSQISVFIEQSAIPTITEEIASSFSGGGARGYEYGPAFVPGEICRRFRSAGEKFVNLYIKIRTQRISVILRKRFTTPNWVKHKEPRDVHMFVDLLLQELEAARSEVKQILPQGIRKHHRSDSNGSTTSSRSNPLRDDRMGRSNTHRARSQLLETHLAKLFKQKVEIFTKVEYTQESVVSTIVKLSLKSLQEFVRLQTFNRSGFQQIQLDIQFLRMPLKEIAEDEAAVDFLLDEVIVAASERCLDPIPLEPPILDKLIQAKLAKS